MTDFQRKLIIASLLLVCSLCLFNLQLSGASPERNPVNGGKALFLPSQAGLWQPVSTPFVGAAIHQLLPDPTRPDRIYAATEVGLFASQDGGRHWVKVDIRPLTSAATEREPVSEPVLAVARARGAWLVGTRRGLLMSRDEGQSWKQVAGGLPPDAVPLTIAVAPSRPDVVYLGAARQGVFRSQDGGDHWQAANEGLPPALGAAPITPIYHLLVDPTDQDTVYAATEVQGIYATHDGGRHWQAANDGLPGLQPYRTYPPLLALDAQHPALLYALIGYPVHSHKVETKLYLSTDNAQHWEALAMLPENVAFRSLTFSREDPRRLLIGSEAGVLTFLVDDAVPSSSALNRAAQLAVPDRLASTAAPAAQAPPDFDVGNVAVLHDDGTLMHLFDLNGLSIQFQRVSNRNYTASFIPLAFDATPGQPLTLGDDEFASVDIPFPFRYYNRDRSQVFVNSNGNLTFTRGSRSAIPSLGGFIGRIAVFWTDLDPSQGGRVTVSSSADRLVITWTNVPQADAEAVNTFQVILLDDDRIIMNFTNVQSRVGLTGITPGTLLPFSVDFTEDLPLSRSRRSILEFFNGAFDIQAIGRRFYQTHPDDFDYLVAFGASSIPHDVVGSGFAFHAPIQNDVEGIGVSRGEFNGGPSAFGSDGRLQSFLNMNKLDQYPDNPWETFLGTNSTLDVLAQEAGHRWLAFVYFNDGGTPSSALLGRDFAHWSFFLDTDASEMEGNRWFDNGNGTFTSIEATSRYSPLDRYLMGLAFPGEVPPFFLIKDPSETGGRVSSSPPEVGVTVKGTRQNVTVTQIIEQEGERIPPFPLAPNRFSQAFILIVPEGGSASPADLNKLETIRQSWEVFFSLITGGRGSLNTRLPGGANPDLAPTNLGVSPSTVSAGASININLVIANQGSGVAGSAIHEIRLSSDSLIDSHDTLLATLVTNPLAPGSSASFSFSVTIPTGTTSGQKFIGVIVDAGNAVSEANEANNAAFVPITVSGGGFGADLIPINLMVAPATVPVGGSITINVTILNQGSAAAPQATHEVRLSNDSIIDASDTFLTGFITSTLPPGGQITFSINVNIPAGTPAGGKFLGVIVDALNQVAESNEGNNTASVFINVSTQSAAAR